MDPPQCDGGGVAIAEVYWQVFLEQLCHRAACHVIHCNLVRLLWSIKDWLCAGIKRSAQRSKLAEEVCWMQTFTAISSSRYSNRQEMPKIIFETVPPGLHTRVGAHYLGYLHYDVMT